MEHKYSKLKKNTLKGEIFINARNKYIELIANDFLTEQIISIEYIDKQIQLINLNNSTLIIDNTLRLKYITELLSKECIKGTSNLIATICL
jgi:hypothetical protein